MPCQCSLVMVAISYQRLRALKDMSPFAPPDPVSVHRPISLVRPSLGQLLMRFGWPLASSFLTFRRGLHQGINNSEFVRPSGQRLPRHAEGEGTRTGLWRSVWRSLPRHFGEVFLEDTRLCCGSCRPSISPGLLVGAIVGPNGLCPGGEALIVGCVSGFRRRRRNDRVLVPGCRGSLEPVVRRNPAR